MKKKQSNKSKYNGGLTLCWFCFNSGPKEERKAIQPTWRLFRIGFYYSLTDEPFCVRFSRAFSSLYSTDRLLFGDPQNFLHDEDRARNFDISALRLCKSHCLLAAVRKDQCWNKRHFWLVKGEYRIDKILSEFRLLSFIDLACSSNSCLSHSTEL